ncbi:MATE family efflux transporter [Spiroplasma taiwanense]|uniref:MATE family efflux transporter n=1 Tax=Spiroplasma taiwanense TaxID=2145 RepID=UPI00035A338F|nr:MATE family efflux transporter [Spiroplasma taiwanense]
MKTKKVSHFEKIKTPFYKIDNVKDIAIMAISIFIQLLFNILISQINLIALNHYKDEVYAGAVAKATLSYNTLQFIPSLIATGAIVVAGNLIGQGKKEEVSKVVVTGLLVNFTITGVIFISIEAAANEIGYLMGASNNTQIIYNNVILEPNELKFVADYYRYMNIKLIMMSLPQVFIAGLQSMKKSTVVTIEMGVWNLCNFGTGAAIAHLSPNAGNDTWLVLHRSATSIGQYSSAFIQAMGTVTSVFVARKVGENNKQGAYEVAINCWKASIYATLIANVIMIALSWPLLELMGPKNTWCLEEYLY